MILRRVDKELKVWGVEVLLDQLNFRNTEGKQFLCFKHGLYFVSKLHFNDVDRPTVGDEHRKSAYFADELDGLWIIY